jgi:hypothetical protein
VFSLDSELVIKEAASQAAVRRKARRVHMADGDSLAMDTEDGHADAATTSATKADFNRVLAVVAKRDAEIAKLTRRLELRENASKDSKSPKHSPRVARPRNGQGRSPVQEDEGLPTPWFDFGCVPDPIRTSPH